MMHERVPFIVTAHRAISC